MCRYLHLAEIIPSYSNGLTSSKIQFLRTHCFDSRPIQSTLVYTISNKAMSFHWFVSPNGLSLVPNTWLALNIQIPSFLPINYLNTLNNYAGGILFNNQQTNPINVINSLLNSAQTNISTELTNNYQNTQTSTIEIEENPTMDSTDTYIKKSCFRDADQWSVHFPNKHALPIDEIENIISDFATAKKINQTGDATGICFINFTSLEDAQRCVEGLKGHELIQLRENKSIRDRESKKRTFMNQNRNAGNDDDTNMWNNRDDDFSVSSNSKSHKVSEESIFDKVNTGIKNDQNQSSAINDTEIVSEDSNHWSSTHAKQPNRSDQQSKINNNDYKDDKTEIKEDMQFKEIITDLKNKNVIDSNTFDYLNKEIKEIKCNEVTELKIPELVAKKNIPEKIISTEKATVIDRVKAQELIVANIHEDYSTNYILHLLEKYQPIGATFVKVSKPHSLRYCHVYFMSVEQTEEVKQNFDNFKLGSKNLIVLRSNYLTGISVS